MIGGVTIAVSYIALFALSWFVLRAWRKRRAKNDFTSLKTVTFGDESAIKPDRGASIISILTIFLIWGAFTGSKLTPFHVPGPFKGETSFTYTARNAAGDTDDATVSVSVHDIGLKPTAPIIASSEGFAKDDAAVVPVWRSVLLKPVDNDGDGATIIAINGQPVTAETAVSLDNAKVVLTTKRSLAMRQKQCRAS